jgi:hypothetical protein
MAPDGVRCLLFIRLRDVCDGSGRISRDQKRRRTTPPPNPTASATTAIIVTKIAFIFGLPAFVSL